MLAVEFTHPLNHILKHKQQQNIIFAYKTEFIFAYITEFIFAHATE